VTVEFGAGGPRIRLFIGDPEAVAGLPAPVVAAPRARLPRAWPILAGAIVIGAAIGVWLAAR
jgi:hypothetical protein